MKAALPSLKADKQKKKKDAEVEQRALVTPKQFAHEIERTLGMTVAHLTASVTHAIRVGSSTFTADQLSANIAAVVEAMVGGHVPGKWKGVKSVHIKEANSIALPIWLAEELWQDEGQVLEEHEEEAKSVEGPLKNKADSLISNQC